MSLINEHDLAVLLRDLKGVNCADKEGCYDYAFLEETIFPTLLPALGQLSERVEQKNMPPMPPAEGLPPDPNAFNPLRSLAELLMRQHPDGVFKKESAYSQHLGKLAAARRQQRLQRELLIKEQERKEKEEAMRQELERTEAEEKEKKAREEQQAAQLVQKLAHRRETRTKEAEEKAGSLTKVLALRETCLKVIEDFDFQTASDTAAVWSMIYKETCKMLVTESNATFAAVGHLDAPGLASKQLHYHTAADKKQFEIEEEEEPEEEGGEAVQKPPKEAPAPEITTRDLPPADDELAMILKRGSGVTWNTVIDGMPYEDEEGEERRQSPAAKYVADVKFTEGMFFFEDKRPGTWLAVPIFKDGEVFGVICGDTLDSVLGSELQASEVPLFEAAAWVMQQCLDYAEWCLLDARRKQCTLRLKSLVKDPRTLPRDFAAAFVDSVDLLVPGMHVAVAVFDTDNNVRLVCNKAHNGTKTEDEAVTAEDTREHIALIFRAKKERDAVHQKTEKEDFVAIATPILDVKTFVPAVLYVAAAPKAKPPHEDVIDFVQQTAIIAQSVLLAPAPNAMRVLRVLAAAGIGDPKELYAMAAQLCRRFTSSPEVFIACTHGSAGIRVLHQVGSNIGKVVGRSEYPACDEAIRTHSTAVKSGFVAVPLCRRAKDGHDSAFGVIAIQSGGLSGDAQVALEGVGAALSAALEVSEFRRKMVVCSHTALEGLLKRATDIKGVYFAFCDLGGQQVCAAVKGEVVEGEEPVAVGKSVSTTSKVQTQAVQPGGTGPSVGFLGVSSEVVAKAEIKLYADTAWDILQDVADTLANVSTALAAEGLMIDQSSSDYAAREESLSLHFNVVRFDLVTESTVKQVNFRFIDATKKAPQPSPITQKIMSAIMYIMGHQQRDVSEWAKCRKLITHHLFKEMKMIDIRSKLKVHKLKLSKECIVGLDAGEIATEVGPMPLALWKWVLMILDVQGL